LFVGRRHSASLAAMPLVSKERHQPLTPPACRCARAVVRATTHRRRRVRPVSVSPALLTPTALFVRTASTSSRINHQLC
jgi:hypothetical protein